MEQIYMEIQYPDGEIEYWDFDQNFYPEIKRLQKIHNNKIKYKLITHSQD